MSLDTSRTHKRERTQLSNPVRLALPVSEADLIRPRLQELLALEAFRKGAGAVQDWHELAAMVCVTKALAGAGIGAECLPLADAALAALRAVWCDGGAMALDADGLHLVCETLASHEAQRRCATRREYELAVCAALRASAKLASQPER